MELRSLHTFLGRRSYEVQVTGGASADRDRAPAAPQVATTKHRTSLRMNAANHTRPRMNADQLLCQSLRTKPHLPLLFRRMTHCTQHTLSQAVQNQSHLTYQNVPGKLDVPLPGLKNMTCVEHLNSDLNLPLFYCCCCYYCQGKGSASHVNCGASWYTTCCRTKTELVIMRFVVSARRSLILLSSQLNSHRTIFHVLFT